MIQNPATLARVEAVRAKGKVVLAPKPWQPPGITGARAITPMILAADADNQADAALIAGEQFGPISFIVATGSAAAGIAEAARLARDKGAITASVYSTDEAVLEAAADAFAAAGVSLSCNLTGGVFVNQSAAFSDYHVTGANPAGNACLTDSAFVANRFRAVGMRRPAA